MWVWLVIQPSHTALLFTFPLLQLAALVCSQNNTPLLCFSPRFSWHFLKRLPCTVYSVTATFLTINCVLSPCSTAALSCALPTPRNSKAWSRNSFIHAKTLHVSVSYRVLKFIELINQKSERASLEYPKFGCKHSSLSLPCICLLQGMVGWVITTIPWCWSHNAAHIIVKWFPDVWECCLSAPPVIPHPLPLQMWPATAATKPCFCYVVKKRNVIQGIIRLLHTLVLILSSPPSLTPLPWHNTFTLVLKHLEICI